MDNEAFVSGLATLAVAFVFGFLGWRLWHRRVSKPAQIPAMQFGVFWLALGAVTIISGSESIAAAFTPPPLAVVVTGLYLQVLLICVLLWGLLGYLFYLFLGRQFVIVLSSIYAVAYVVLLYFMVGSNPDLVTVSFGQVGLHYANPIGEAVGFVLLGFFLLPELAGAVLMFSLFFRTKEPTVRYRVTLVSWSLIFWIVLSSLPWGGIFGAGLTVQLAGSLLGAAAAGAIYLAYYPPERIRLRLGVQSVDQDMEESPSGGL